MEEICQKYYKSIKSYIGKKIDDEGVVEELTNDVMMAAINSYQRFEGRAAEFSWVCSIANHKVVDYYRKKKLKTILFSANPIFEEVADKALGPERDSLKEELLGEVRKTLEDLEEGSKKILRLKYLDGLKVKEIAKALKISVKAVESRLMRAKDKFRQAWAYDKAENNQNWKNIGTDNRKTDV